MNDETQITKSGNDISIEINDNKDLQITELDNSSNISVEINDNKDLQIIESDIDNISIEINDDNLQITELENNSNIAVEINDSKDLQIIELENNSDISIEIKNDDIIIQVDGNIIDWAEIIGNPESNQALVSLLNRLLAQKQGKLTAGAGITIDSNDVISTTAASPIWGSIQGTLSNQTDLKNALDSKQETLIAGAGINITNNVISTNQASPTWGSIQGTLSNQTDLQTALNSKQTTITDLETIRNNASAGKSASETISGYGNIVTHNTSEFATSVQGQLADTALQPGDNITELVNNAGYITGITSSDVTTALGYTPYNATNPNNYQTATQVNNTVTSYHDNTKQDKLTAGTGINISAQNVISCTQASAQWGNITGQLENQTDLNKALLNKQNRLTEGPNIHITQAENLPKELTQVEYAESQGQEYVILDYGIRFEDELEIAFSLAQPEKEENIYILSTQESQEIKFSMGVFERKYSFLIRDITVEQSQLNPITKADSEILTWVYKNGICSIPSKSCSLDVSNYYFDKETDPLVLFKGSQSLVTGRIKFLRLKREGELISHIVPVVDSRGECFFFDLVTLRPYETKEGRLTAGPVVTDTIISATDTTYTAGTGISIQNGVISSTQASPSWGNITGTLSNQTDLQNALNSKQGTLTAGSNISIVNNTVSFTGTIPTVNDATLTIQKNGTTIDTFTANSATNKTVDIIVPTSSGQISYTNPDYPTVEAALDKLLYVTPSVSITGGGNYEIGSTRATTNLSWTWNKTIKTQSLNQGIGSLATNVRSYTYTNPLTSNTTFTITGSDGTNTRSASTTVSFLPKRYWGVSANTTLTDAEILALSSELSTSRAQTRTFNCSGGKYFYLVIRTSYCSGISFKVGGLSFSDVNVVTRNVVNAQGYTASYNIYRPNNIQTGSAINVVVS